MEFEIFSSISDSVVKSYAEIIGFILFFVSLEIKNVEIKMQKSLVLICLGIFITFLSPQQSAADALRVLSNEPASKYDLGVINMKFALEKLKNGANWPADMMAGDPLIKNDNKLHIPLSAFGKTEKINIKKCTSAIEQVRKAAAVNPKTGTLYPPYSLLGYSLFADMLVGTGYVSTNVSNAIKRLDKQIVISCVMLSSDAGSKTVFGRLVSKSYEIHGDM